MQKTLIIPDVHEKPYLFEKVINSFGPDQIVFLGDYFDAFDDTPEMIEETCAWLSYSVSKPNRIHLRGNHDCHYEFEYRNFECSGYAQWKYFQIQDSIKKEVWYKLKWYHVLDNTFLLTHAGLHRHWVPKEILNIHDNRTLFLEKIQTFLDENLMQGFRDFHKSKHPWIFGAGFGRGGNQPAGGITWCDFTREFKPIIGLNQIFGHTAQGAGVATWLIKDTSDKIQLYPSNMWTPPIRYYNDTTKSINIDLDVLVNKHWAVWDGTTLQIFNYKDHM